MNENTNNSANQAAPKVFDIIDGNTLMAQEYEPLQFAVEKILPHGLFILAGSGKIGKSWLSLDLCVSVLYGYYMQWAKDNGYKPLNNKNFVGELRRRYDIRRDGKDGNVVVGLALSYNPLPS